MSGLDPVQAFAFAFCGMEPEWPRYWFKPGDVLYAKWEPAITWGLDYARARRGRTQTLVKDVAEAMAPRPLGDGHVYPDGHEPRWTAAVSAMIDAAQRQARSRAAEQGGAAA